jgi:hypothetical protein
LAHQVYQLFQQQGIPEPRCPDRSSVVDNTEFIPTFIAFTYGRSMLEQTLRGYKQVEWEGIVIIDNSKFREAYRDREILKEKYGVRDVIETTSHLTFSQLQNTFNFYARKWDVPWYLWTHSDALLVPQYGISHYQEAIRCIYESSRNVPSTGFVFFGYDLLAAFQTEAFSRVPFDEGIIHYGSDCDVYYRVRFANYTNTECRIGRVFNMHGVMESSLADQLFTPSVSEADYNSKVQLVEQAIKDTASYSWRNSDMDSQSRMSEAEKQAYNAQSEASKVYFKNKYSAETSCDVQSSWGRAPNFDV